MNLHIRRGVYAHMEAVLPKPHKDRPIEGRMAKWYASNTGKMMTQFVELARRIAQQLPPNAQVLEIAPGPGYFAIELAKLGDFSITGVDLSQDLVNIAAANARQAGVRVEFKQGNASRLPVEDNSFDFLLCRAAFKNFGEPVKALQEMHRVLKPGGRAMIIDLRKHAPLPEINRAVDEMHLDAWNRWITKLTFRFLLLRTAYSRPQFDHMLAQSGFRGIDVKEEGIGFEITLTK